jgi:hypothetical protein
MIVRTRYRGLRWGCVCSFFLFLGLCALILLYLFGDIYKTNSKIHKNA